jgi:hypothetical protein
MPVPPQTTHGGLIGPFEVTNDLGGRIPRRKYSYWPDSRVLLDGSMLVFCGNQDGQAQFFTMRPDGTVSILGSLQSYYKGETEGWYFGADGKLYLIPSGSSTLHRIDPFSGDDEVVFHISKDYPNCDIWQAHSSDDGTVHCATVRRILPDQSTQPIATVLAVGQRLRYIPAAGKLDESHLTSDGKWLIIEEDDTNRVINIATGDEKRIIDPDGALSHIDCGPGYMVGEDNINGKCWKWDLNAWTKTALFDTWGMGHVSVRNGRCLRSSDVALEWVDLNGGGLTKILDHLMVTGPGDAYDYQVKASLDVTGTVAVYMTNHGNPNGPQSVMVVGFS